MFFVVFSGWGILTIPILLVTAAAVTAAVQLSLEAAGHPDLAFLAFSLGLFAAAGANWAVGRRLNSRPGRELVDPRTGERVLLQTRHRLFWIRMEYWSVPGAVLGLIPLLAIGSLFN